VPKRAQENKSGAQYLRLFGKIGFLKPEIRYPRNLWENRISQTVPKVSKKSDFLDKSDFSNKPCAQTCPKKINQVPKKSDLLKKSDFSNPVPKRAQKNKSGAQEIRFVEKIGFLSSKTNSGIGSWTIEFL
jgi:hypothetical protein